MKLSLEEFIIWSLADESECFKPKTVMAQPHRGGYLVLHSGALAKRLIHQNLLFFVGKVLLGSKPGLYFNKR